jgi:hypothetical protein
LVITGCPGVAEDRNAAYSVTLETAPLQGVVVLLSGGAGTSWIVPAGSIPGELAVARLRAAGLRVIQLRWRKGWLNTTAGAMVGPKVLACRPATALHWIHRTLYQPLGLTESPGRCGICLAGHSAGASQVAYAVSYYGLADLAAAVVFVGGPPHAAIDAGCLRRPGEEAYWYDDEAAGIMDASYGADLPGPCLAHDAAAEAVLARDSADATGGDFALEGVRVHFLFGAEDDVEPLHGARYASALEAAGADVTVEVLPGTGHGLGSGAALGFSRLAGALLGEPPPPPPTTTTTEEPTTTTEPPSTTEPPPPEEPTTTVAMDP